VVLFYRNSDFFNLLDMPALILATLTLMWGTAGLTSTGETPEAFEPLLAISVLLLWFRQLRVLYIFPSMAPLVLIVFNMMSAQRESNPQSLPRLRARGLTPRTSLQVGAAQGGEGGPAQGDRRRAPGGAAQGGPAARDGQQDPRQPAAGQALAPLSSAPRRAARAALRNMASCSASLSM